ncbi:UPF0489 protein C5orf22 homolog isoform X1 [Macrobrachium nipponense]|uniref:UPF0489 protein C5orf22 homolog isoform X1 n=2 Tax=Macrobrachium nipponense TaxID=159736 RepID=UPI0030C888FE
MEAHWRAQTNPTRTRNGVGENITKVAGPLVKIKMSIIKKYPQLPVHIVEDHNDALYHILRAVGSKHLPFNNNLLIHFDSHPDLLIPSELKASEVYDIPVMLPKLSIENWILVAAFAGQISSIVWMKPPWSNQIENGDYSFYIGRKKNTDSIRVSCPILYFVAEMLYSKKEDLEDEKEVLLLVRTLDYETNDNLEKDILDLVKKHGEYYILDIDLDFFTTMNPFLGMHPKVEMYSRLREIYSFDFTATQEDEVLDAQNKRCNQITDLKNIFMKLQELKDINEIEKRLSSLCEAMEPAKQKSIVNLIEDLCHEYGSEVDWELVHDAGCTCDDRLHELPHHISTNEEIDSLMASTRKLITSFPSPTIITLARSSLDDYCPPNQVNKVQEVLCEFLRKSFDIECKLHYKNGQ